MVGCGGKVLWSEMFVVVVVVVEEEEGGEDIVDPGHRCCLPLTSLSM